MTILYLATEDVASSRVSGKVHFWAAATALQERGHRVIVVAPRFPGSETGSPAPAIELVCFSAPGKSAWGILVFELILASHAWWLRRSFHPDAVMVRGGGPGWFMGLVFVIFRCLGMPVILECNGIVWRELCYRGQSHFHVLNAYLSAWQQALTCNLIIGVSDGITETYRRLGWRRTRCCRTIPNGTNPSSFQVTAAERQSAREQLDFPLEAYVAGYIGVFSPWHDIRGMVGAAELLMSQGEHDIRIVLVGRGPLFDWACQQKAQRNLALLVLPGEVAERDELRRWIACLDVGLCVYTDLEGSPLKLFEYMAAELPIIGSGFPQVLALCQQHGIGRGLPEAGAAAIAAAIVAMRDERDHWVQIGRRNRQLVEEQFTWRRVAADVEAAILDCRFGARRLSQQ
jgi:glycosyltransferase involved in cell wall biosynthesis